MSSIITLHHLGIESWPAWAHCSATGSQARTSLNFELEFQPPLTWNTCNSSPLLASSSYLFQVCSCQPISGRWWFSAVIINHMIPNQSEKQTLLMAGAPPPSNHCQCWNNPTAAIPKTECLIMSWFHGMSQGNDLCGVRVAANKPPSHNQHLSKVTHKSLIQKELSKISKKCTCNSPTV